jgi:hypothetical protein
MGQRDAEIENAMADTEPEFERRRLGWEADRPLAKISNQATDALVPVITATINWTRRSGEERPLISVLLDLQAGFALGRWGGRRA